MDQAFSPRQRLRQRILCPWTDD